MTPGTRSSPRKLYYAACISTIIFVAFLLSTGDRLPGRLIFPERSFTASNSGEHLNHGLSSGKANSSNDASPTPLAAVLDTSFCRKPHYEKICHGLSKISRLVRGSTRDTTSQELVDVQLSEVVGQLIDLEVERPRDISDPGPGMSRQGPCSFRLAKKSNGGNIRVVVSISSMLGRVEYVMDTLKSIFQQSYGAPDMVYLSVPKTIKRLGSEREPAGDFQLPENVTAMLKTYGPRLRILHPPDYGAATKLLAALPEENDPQTIIITVDDDTTYHTDMVGCLVGAMRELPPTFTVATLCEEYDPVLKIGWYVGDRPGVCGGYPSAYAGLAYRRGYFNADWARDPVYDLTSAPEACWLHDDVWLGGHMFRRGIRPYSVARNWFSVTGHRETNHLSISQAEGTWELKRECIEYFSGFVQSAHYLYSG